MKSKKLISLLCAAALSVSAFAGMVITSSAAETVLWSDNFDAYDNVVDGHDAISADYPRVLLDGTLTADNQYDGISGLLLQTCNRGQNTSFYAIQDGKNAGSKSLMATTASTEKQRGGKIFFVEKEKDAEGKVVNKTYTPESGKDLVLAFNLKTTDTEVTGAGHKLSINGDVDAATADANVVDFDEELGIGHDTWNEVKIVINATSGAKFFVDGTEKETANGANITNLSSMVFYSETQYGEGKTSTDCPKWYFDDMVIYSSDDGAASTVPGAEGGTQATPEPELDAPALEAADGAVEDTIQTYDFNSIDNGTWSIGTTDQQKFDSKGAVKTEDNSVKVVPGLSIEVGGRGNGAEGSTFAAIQKYGTGKVLNLNAARFATGGRGPRFSLDNDIPAEEGYTVTAFAFRLSPIKGREADAKPRLYLLGDTVQAGDDGMGAYRHIAAVFTTIEGEEIHRNPEDLESNVISTYVTPNEWHYASVVADPSDGDKAPYRIYVDYDPSAEKLEPNIKSDYVGYGDNAQSLAKVPMFAVETQAAKVSDVETTPAYSYALIDNVVAYSATGSEPRRVIATPTEAEKPEDPTPAPATPTPTPTPAPTLQPAVTGITINPVAVGDAKVTLTGVDGKTARLIHASYDANGVLTKVELKDAAAEVEITAAEAGDKIMVWNAVSATGMNPAAAAVEVPAAAAE